MTETTERPAPGLRSEAERSREADDLADHGIRCMAVVLGEIPDNEYDQPG